jgi:hypothetical protein
LTIRGIFYRIQTPIAKALVLGEFFDSVGLETLTGK